MLDHVHANLADAGVLERYCVAKMAGGGAIDESAERLSWSVKRSLAGFRARQREEHAWLESRIEAATELLGHHVTETDDEATYRGIAATVGLSLDVVNSLAQRLASAGPSADASVTEWGRCCFAWLADVPNLLDQVIRHEDLDSLFGKPFNQMEKREERINYAVPRLKQLTRLWMNGRPLRELEIALGVEPTKLKTCDGARKFIIRIVPSLAYAFSLPALLKQHAASPDGSEAGVVPPQLAELAHCVRHGFDTHEKAALNQHLRNERLSRVLVHERFSAIQPHLTAAPLEETWADTLARVEAAILQIGKQ